MKPAPAVVSCTYLGQGRSTYCKPVITKLISWGRRKGPTTECMVNFPRQQEDFVTLSEREREVLQCIAGGLSSKQCAHQLGIAPRTVERNVENLRNNRTAKSKQRLVAKALAGGHL